MNHKNSSLILYEILKEAPQLSSLSIDAYSLQDIFDKSELCKYLNKKIKKLNQNYLWYTSFYNDHQENEFCEIFSNIEHLQCAIRRQRNFFLLLDHLPKLSTAKVEWGCKYD